MIISAGTIAQGSAIGMRKSTPHDANRPRGRVRRRAKSRAHLSDNPAELVKKLVGLREAGLLAEAESLGKGALARFPESAEVCHEYAMVAYARADLAEAARRWELMRSQIPDHPVSYVMGVAMLRELSRLEEAEALAEAGLIRFPEEAAIWNQHAQTAFDRHDLPEAARRWEETRIRFPDVVDGHSMSAMALRELGRLDDAEALAKAGVVRFPEDAGIAIQYAWTAYVRPNWPEVRPDALARWEDVRHRFPDNSEGYAMNAHALLRLGRLDEAEAVISEAAKRFPTDYQVLVYRAQTAARRRDWPEALRRWKDVQALYPQGYEISEGFDMLRMVSQLERVDREEIGAHAPLLSRPGQGGAESDTSKDGSGQIIGNQLTDDPDLFRRFESLGGSCEFGIAQRIGGAHTLGLLRWCSIQPDKLVKLLESRFEGIGLPEHTFVTLTDVGEYALVDKRYFTMHTFVEDRQADADKFLEQMCRRLLFLKNKLIEDLENGEKIFVYKPSDSLLKDSEIMAIWRAIGKYGTNAVLCVRLHDELHPAGTVEQLTDGLLVGYIDRVPTSMDQKGISYDCWVSICQSAARLARTPQAQST